MSLPLSIEAAKRSSETKDDDDGPNHKEKNRKMPHPNESPDEKTLPLTKSLTKNTIRMPKCFTLHQNAVKLIEAMESITHWYWKSFGHGEYYGTPIFIKQIPRPTTDEKQIQTFQSIAALLTDLHHPNIAHIIPNGIKNLSNIYIDSSVVTERLECGDLATLLKNSTTLTQEQCVQILLDVACGMSYLHEQSPPLLHRDLRAASIHITYGFQLKISTNDNFRAKITNFELAGQLGLNKALVGTPAWVAPEIMRRDTNYTEKIDMMNRQSPYADETMPKAELLREVADKGKRPNVMHREQWPTKLVELMELCWSDDASKRPSFMTIVKLIRSNDESN
ncbi:serine/threonine kinase [Thraustotheca clavata]|uniref:Serine/threonine kinase n=1 Tax=Thraustotheca clavata TaxID=74557 RepID=A0A1V9Z2H7_9STRA|nr:serine/threonine kinase [Thraustotheca clavata]